MPSAMPKFRKTPPELITAFDGARPEHPGVTRKTMFGYPAYFLDGNMFAFTFGPRVAVRADEATRARMSKGGAVFEIMPGRPMNAYVEVPASELTGATLKRWIAVGLACAAALPAKGAKTATIPKTPKTPRAARSAKTATTVRAAKAAKATRAARVGTATREGKTTQAGMKRVSKGSARRRRA